MRSVDAVRYRYRDEPVPVQRTGNGQCDRRPLTADAAAVAAAVRVCVDNGCSNIDRRVAARLPFDMNAGQSNRLPGSECMNNWSRNRFVSNDRAIELLLCRGMEHVHQRVRSRASCVVFERRLSQMHVSNEKVTRHGINLQTICYIYVHEMGFDTSTVANDWYRSVLDSTNYCHTDAKTA
jgi:hypothetical protein